jgi:phospholipid/cholesterol/gamma-HCH transport system substrate-binding protein
MENRAYAFAVGLFTVLLGAGVVVAAMWFSGKTEARDSYVLETRYPVTGLNVQAPVRFRGVEVGKVEAIDFSGADSRVIQVRVAVRRGTQITRGTYGQLGSQGVTGLSYVILDDDGSRPERLSPSDPNARIPVRPSFLDEVAGSGKDLLADVKQVAVRVNALLNESNQAQLVRALAGIEAATGRIAAITTRIDPALANLPALTEDARRVLARADELMRNLNKVALELDKHMDAVERVAKSAEQLGGAADAVSTAAVAETLPRLNGLIDELGRTSRDLDRLLAELHEQPASLVFGRPPAVPGPGEPGFSAPAGGVKR